MGGMEFNKIFAAILVAGIIAMFGGFVSKALVHPKHIEQNAFNIEAAADDGAGGPAKAAGPEPILSLIAAADVAKGEKIAKACAACHTFNQGGPNGVGPNLWGVLGGPKHHVAGFAYSGALIEHGGKTWNYAEMNKFLWKPKAYAPATKMSFAGVKKAEDRAALLAWMRTQSGSPAALPSDGDIAAENAELAPPEPAAEAPAADAAAAPVDVKAAEAAPAAPAAAKH